MAPDTNTDWLFQLFNEIGIIHQLSSAELQKALAPGLNQSEFGVLNHFVRLQTPASPSRLAAAFQMTKPSMTAVLGKLSAKAYVTVTADPADKRAKIVNITAGGRAAHADALKALSPVMSSLSMEVDGQELKRLLPVLAELRSIMDARRNGTNGQPTPKTDQA